MQCAAFTVNHSIHWKDPKTGVCTNTVEGLNRALKAAVPPRYRKNQFAPQFVNQFLWRRVHKNDLCEAFFRLAKNNFLENKQKSIGYKMFVYVSRGKHSALIQSFYIKISTFRYTCSVPLY